MIENIVSIIRECGTILLSPPSVKVNNKNQNPKDLVTSCDLKIQEILKEILKNL